ncbi:MAG: hypothetical protein KDE09_01460 [Anaerolineales bacterium]|nr:hypothetical protein [Anaerolineales bacterium]MCB0007494.1 hypothetical protein [Anaerolineales bacterium]MCB0010259.1 hypothetical protein [Anaerolineales bacterium]MCB0016422.1 hypothetical protein [Anaerolineales bacterium]MCB8959110.1 hypothetical protein [Ardenticatenales bacterium]
MSAKKSLFFGFLAALAFHGVVLTILAVARGFQSEWALVQLRGVAEYWHIALYTYALLGLVLGRVIWDSVYRPGDDRIDASKSYLLQKVPAA